MLWTQNTGQKLAGREILGLRMYHSLCSMDFIDGRVYGSGRVAVFRRSSISVYYTECKPKSKKWGRPGNETTCTLLLSTINVQFKYLAPPSPLCYILMSPKHGTYYVLNGISPMKKYLQGFPSDPSSLTLLTPLLLL